MSVHGHGGGAAAGPGNGAFDDGSARLAEAPLPDGRVEAGESSRDNGVELHDMRRCGHARIEDGGEVLQGRPPLPPPPHPNRPTPGWGRLPKHPALSRVASIISSRT